MAAERTCPVTGDVAARPIVPYHGGGRGRRQACRSPHVVERDRHAAEARDGAARVDVHDEASHGRPRLDRQQRARRDEARLRALRICQPQPLTLMRRAGGRACPISSLLARSDRFLGDALHATGRAPRAPVPVPVPVIGTGGQQGLSDSQRRAERAPVTHLYQTTLFPPRAVLSARSSVHTAQRRQRVRRTRTLDARRSSLLDGRRSRRRGARAARVGIDPYASHRHRARTASDHY